MKLGDYKLVFVVVGLIGVLLIASPALFGAISSLSEGKQFSEFYLLGPEKKAENYPSNIAVDQTYSVYLNVVNRLGYSAYYILYVKLANESEQLPNTTHGKPSPLLPLYEYRFSIPNGASWQNLLSFSVSKAAITPTNSVINTLKINGNELNVEKQTAWNSNTTQFTYRLFFELWLYNEKTGLAEFNNSYVNLRLNLTTTP